MTTELQVSEDLSQMKWQQFLHGLKFDKYAILDDEVDSIGSFELDTVIDDRKPNLMREADAIVSQLIAETSVVSALETASSQRAVNFERGTKNPFRDRSVQTQFFISVSSVSSVVASCMTPSRMQPPVPR